MRTLRYTGAAPKRLDAYLLAEEPGLTQGLLHKYLRENKIKLNGKRQPLATRLQAGDEVRLYLPDRDNTLANTPAAPAAGGLAPLQVLYEDAGLLAADKPAGLPCLAAVPGADSLLARAAQHTALQGDAAPALCHRLDTGTSGVVLLAKTQPVLEAVTWLLRHHRLQKTYWGVTFGHPRPAAGVVQGFLCKDAKRGFVRVCARGAPGAQSAETRYHTLATSGPLALVNLSPVTGRTHQLRVHMASLGTPLLGDGKYGVNTENRKRRCRYQLLCAHEIRFPPAAQFPTAAALAAGRPPGKAACEGPAFGNAPAPDAAALAAVAEAYAGLAITAAEPWFYGQLLSGELV